VVSRQLPWRCRCRWSPWQACGSSGHGPGFACWRRAGSAKKIALAALLSTPFAVPPIVVDLVWVLGSGNFVDLPDALVFYPVMAFVAETVFHLLPLAILVGLAGMRRQP
jgi:ABC-type Fe3+ transport system permease subunit